MKITAKLILIFIFVGIAPLLVGGFFLLYSFDIHLNQIMTENVEASSIFMKEMTSRYIAFSLILLLPIALTSFFLSRKVTRPLKEISLAAKKVAKGDFKAKANISSKDEFGELSRNFNKMTGEIERLREDIEDEKNILEIKVRARTRELKEMNETLESQIEERTHEMKKKLEEFEKMSKLMVGRELRMKEMKKELEDTRKEIERLKEEGSPNK